MIYTFGKRKNISNNSAVQNILQESKQKKETTPNSMMLRIMEDQQAENEAEQLSKDVTSTTPDEIMRGMGSRLGADFSNVQFHSDSLSMNRSRAMDARAYAQAATFTSAKAALIRRDSPESQNYRDRVNDKLKDSIGHLNKTGNHELGHVLESTLNPTDEDQRKGTASNDILQTVISNPQVMESDELSQVEYIEQDGKNKHNKKLYQGQINTESEIFKTKKMTSEYGQSSPKEWFAEAFHDVYTKGAEAKKTSIEIVKEYERRSTEKQKQNFRKKERGRLTRIGRWFSKLFNYGARH